MASSIFNLVVAFLEAVDIMCTCHTAVAINKGCRRAACCFVAYIISATRPLAKAPKASTFIQKVVLRLARPWQRVVEVRKDPSCMMKAGAARICPRGRCAGRAAKIFSRRPHVIASVFAAWSPTLFIIWIAQSFGPYFPVGLGSSGLQRFRFKFAATIAIHPGVRFKDEAVIDGLEEILPLSPAILTSENDDPSWCPQVLPRHHFRQPLCGVLQLMLHQVKETLCGLVLIQMEITIYITSTQNGSGLQQLPYGLLVKF